MSNEFDAAVVSSLQSNQGQAARVGFSVAADTNPDAYAEAQRVAQRTGVPVSTVLAYPNEMKRQAAVGTIDFDTLAQTSPATAALLADVEKAKIAHDNVDNLSGMETLLNSFKRGVPALRSLLPTVGVVNASAGLNRNREIDARIAAGEDIRKVLGDYGDYGLAPMPGQSAEQVQVFWDQWKERTSTNMQRDAADSATSLVKFQAERNAIPLPGVVNRVMAEKTFGGAFGQIASDPLKFIAAIGPESLVQSAPGLLAAIPAGLAAGPGGSAAAMGGNSFLVDYASTLVEAMQTAGIDTSNPDAIREGMKDPAILTKITQEAYKHASIVGLFDTASGGIAGKMLLPKQVAGKLAMRPLAQEMANIALQAPVQGALGGLGELGGELYAGQEVSPGNILSEVFGEFFGTPAEVMSASSNHIRERMAKAKEAESAAALLTRLNQTAAADKVLQRDPDTFERFIESAAEDGPVQQVFIDAKTLMQSGVAEQVAGLSPSVADQLATAVQTGGQIAIPVAEYTARIAPTEYAQQLLEHLKTDSEGFSQAEANQYMQSDGGELRAEVERTLAEKQGDDTFKQSAEVVRNNIKMQLDTAARFTPQVNDAYSAMVGNFYAVMAARAGTTPEAMYQRYPLKIGAESIGGQQFDQLAVTVEQKDASDFLAAKSDAGLVGGHIRDGALHISHAEVAPEMRGKGEGLALYAALIDKALSSGLKVFSDTTVEADAVRVYDALKRRGYDVRRLAGGQLEDGAVYGTDAKQPAFEITAGPQTPGKVLHQGAVGDLAKRDALLSMTAVNAVFAEAEDPDFNAAKKAARERYAALQAATEAQGFGVKTGDGRSIKFSGAGFKEATHHAADRRVLAIVANLDRLFASAVPLYSEPARGKQQAKAFHYYGVKADFGNRGEAFVLLEVLERPNGDFFYDADATSADEMLAASSVPLAAQSETEAGNKVAASRGRLAAWISGVNNAEVLYQEQKVNRGSFDPATLSISLLKNADLSTFLHESGHFFLEVMADMAARPDTPAQVQQDMAALLQWFGLKDLTEWHGLDFEEKRAYHEKFARGFEAYLFEGKAPSIEMQGLFQRFRAWLLNVYRDLKALNVELTDEVRSVFDRMLASTEQITLAEQGRSMMPLFNSAQEAGMTPDEFAAYQALGVDATNDAIQDLQARGLRDMTWLHNARGRVIKQLQKEAKAQRDAVQMDVRREVMSQPVYRAWQFLTGKAGEKTEAQVEHDKTLADWKAERTDYEQKARDDLKAKLLEANPDAKGIQRGQLLAKNKRQIDIDAQQAMLEWDKANPKPEAPAALAEGVTAGGFDFGRLDLGELKTMGLPAEIINAVKARRMTAAAGLHPDIVAEMFGFTSGDELVRKLAEVETPKVEIDALTDVRMLEQHGELSSPEAIEKAADRALHNDARARMIATEANALARALDVREDTGRVDKKGRKITRAVLPSAAKEFARVMIDRLKVRNIRPGQYASAEVRAAKATEKASKAGDLATAAAEKRNQLIQNYATRAAYDAQEEVDKGLRYLKKFDGAIKSLDADYAEQIANLLERFDLRKGQSNKAVDKRTALAEWIKAQREAGMEPDIPANLENEAFRTSYKNLTVEEFRGLVDTVRQIEHLGRLKHKLLTAADQRAYEAVRDEIAASIHQHAQGREADTRTPTTNRGRAVQELKRFWASHIKAATLARVLDGGKDGGPMWEYFVRNANASGDQETTMRAEATTKLSEIMAPVFALGKMGGKGQYFPSLRRSFNREARMAIALNVGNEGNLQRLLGGEGWTVAQVMPLLESLTAQEWSAVQAVWDHFEGYRPQIAAKERRVYGKEPEWVQPGSVITAQFGVRGGYYPIKYDPAASQRAEEHTDAESVKRQLQGAYTTATTRRSFTKARVEEVQGRPLLYTLSGLYSGVNDVIHDLAWHEWLIDTNRLLRSHTIDQAIREHYGPETKQQFKTWAQDIAEGERGADNAIALFTGRLRQGVSLAGLGFNVMSAIMQPLGITQSITRVGAEWVARGVVKYLAGPIDLTRQVNAMSDFMANRARTRFRELNELRNQVQDQSALKEMTGRYAYFLMMRCQQMVDVPTWWGAYEKAIAEGNEETRAVSLADQAVIDAQGGGQTKDLSAVERADPAGIGKIFTVFYSFMNTALNIGVEKTMSADTPAKRAKLAVDYAMLYVVPAVLGYFLKAAVTPGDSGDDDWEKLAKKLLANQIDYLMGLMVGVREFSEAAKTLAGANDLGRDYTGPAGLRLVSDTVQLAKQASQSEFDDAFRKAAVNVVGDMFGLPAAQINRTITGTEALTHGETSNPAAIAFGFQKPR